METPDASEDHGVPAVEPTEIAEFHAPKPAYKPANRFDFALGMAGGLAMGAVIGEGLTLAFYATPALEAAEKAQKETDRVMEIAKSTNQELDQAIQERDRATTAGNRCGSAHEELHETVCKALAAGQAAVVQKILCTPKEKTTSANPSSKK